MSNRPWVLAAGSALLVLACHGKSDVVSPEPTANPASAPGPLADDARAGIQDESLAQVLVDHWDWMMRSSPVWATRLGDHRFDAQIADSSAAAIARDRAARREFLRRLDALDGGAMVDRDRIAWSQLRLDLRSEIALEVCEFEMWSIAANDNPLAQFGTLPVGHPVVTPGDGANLVARYRAIPGAIDDVIANLDRGAVAGMFANAESVNRTIAMVENELDRPLDEWALMAPASAEHPDWSAADLAQFRETLAMLVRDEIRPAYTKYRDYLRGKIAPRARGPAQGIGLIGLPQGTACYTASIAAHLGLERTADELHALGLREIERINAEMRNLGQKLLGTDDLAAILQRLRTDPALYFTSEDEIEDAAARALESARRAIPGYFGILPRTECVVTRIPNYEAPYTTIAYYNAPHYDGSKPGEYMINTYQPTTRPRYQMQVLTFHESIPGHHLQFAIAYEQPAAPAFRKFAPNGAFVEGWALYVERLAEEMGLYSSDLDRMGMLTFDAWRASRLVVDTGIHAMGWTREQAETYMLEHTALAPNNIKNEVDRYISWPGQALSYKVGQLEILRLRAWAEDKLGSRFDLRGFHDAVLENGGVTLPILADQIERWVASVEERGDSGRESAPHDRIVP